MSSRHNLKLQPASARQRGGFEARLADGRRGCVGGLRKILSLFGKGNSAPRAESTSLNG